MPTIYVDMDDVIAESTATFIHIARREFGKKVAFEEIRSFNLQQSFGLSDDEYERLFEVAHRPEAILRFDLMRGAVEVLRNWEALGYTIAIVTGRLTVAWESSQEWLRRNQVPYHSFTMVNKYGREGCDDNIAISLEELSRRQFCLAVEDSAMMARHLSGTMGVPVALMDRPWNQDAVLNGKVTRYRSWSDIGISIPKP